jgi:uncharacterized protein
MRLKIVLDTNAIISALGRKSPYKVVINKLLEDKFDLFVTTEILLEYEEKIIELHNISVAATFLDVLSILPNVHQSTVYYRFLLITHDADDDKFADCAIAQGVHYLVTDDRHYKVLLKLGFPKVNLLKIEEFKALLESTENQ